MELLHVVMLEAEPLNLYMELQIMFMLCMLIRKVIFHRKYCNHRPTKLTLRMILYVKIDINLYHEMEEDEILNT